MSDLNELIHTNATIAYNQGVARERERVLRILNSNIIHRTAAAPGQVFVTIDPGALNEINVSISEHKAV